MLTRTGHAQQLPCKPSRPEPAAHPSTELLELALCTSKQVLTACCGCRCNSSRAGRERLTASDSTQYAAATACSRQLRAGKACTTQPCA